VAPEHTWRKSRRSVNGQNCVELCSTLDQVRDSKNVAGPALRGDMLALVRTIQNGRFDH
jgi:hypothetical protein